MEKYFAKFLNFWVVGKALQWGQPLDEATAEMIGYHFGLDVRALAAPSATRARLEMHAVRPTVRLHADGRTKVELLVILTQRLRVALGGEGQGAEGDGQPDSRGLSFKFRGGCTLIIDPETGNLRYAISKNLKSTARCARQTAFLREQLERLGPAALDRFQLTEPSAGAVQAPPAAAGEPFALTHRGSPDGDVTYG